MAMNRAKLKKGEKRLLVGTTGLAALFVTAGVWWQAANATPVLNIPTPAMPSPNAFDFYAKAGQAQVAANPPVDRVHDNTAPVSAPDSPQELARRYPTAAKEAWLRRNAPALQLLRQGFASEYRHPPASRLSIAFSHYGSFRELARLLVVESHARAERGNWAGASHSALDILHLGNDIPRGGPLMAALVGYAVQAIGRKELWIAVPHLDARAARKAAVRLERLVERRVSCADTLQEDKWLGQTLLLQAMRDRGWRWNLYPKTASWRDRLRSVFMTNRTVMDNYSKRMDMMIANARRPYAAQPPLSPPSDPYTAMVAPDFDSTRWSAARNETANVLLLVSLALRAYHLDRGAYPNRLSELVPTYLKRVPDDPFGAGGPLIYRRTGDANTLYSIGPDGKDNGGKAIEDPSEPRDRPRRYFVQPDSQGDVVAGVNKWQ